MSPLSQSLRAPLAIMFLIFMSMLMVFGWGITSNANKIKEYVYDSCVNRNAIEAQANVLLDQLIDNAAKSAVFSPAEKADRIAGWRAVRNKPEECTRI